MHLCPRPLLPALFALAAGCAGSSLDEPAVPRVSLCAERNALPGCVHPGDVEHWLARRDLEIIGETDTPAGKQGARVLTLAIPESAGRVVFRAKWRAYSTTHRLNHPRYELAAFAVQKLFLSADDTVVPPTAGHCFPIAHYRAHVDPRAEPPFAGIDCIYGTLSYWLEDAMDLDEAEDGHFIRHEQLLDRHLFWSSRSCRRSLANVNLLAVLISHGDSHPKQFLVGGTRGEPRVFLVDNTIAFSGYKNPKIPPDWDWSELRVPALPADSIARLSALSERDVRSLAVVEQYALVEGQLVPTRRTPVESKPQTGLRWRSGDLQIGLTGAEIERVWQQIERVLGAVESGRARTF